MIKTKTITWWDCPFDTHAESEIWPDTYLRTKKQALSEMDCRECQDECIKLNDPETFPCDGPVKFAKTFEYTDIPNGLYVPEEDHSLKIEIKNKRAYWNADNGKQFDCPVYLLGLYFEGILPIRISTKSIKLVAIAEVIKQ